MIVKCGTDLVSINRIDKAAKRLGKPFLNRIWTEEEREYCLPAGRWLAGSSASLAARFAAKEAIAKALGTGIGRRGIRWQDIAVSCDGRGAPQAQLAAVAKEIYENMGGLSIALSLSHEAGLAQAFCVIICDPETTRGSENAI